MNERLYRSRDDRMLAGVAGGMAEIWDADPSLVRFVWALLAVLTGGLAIVVYIVMAIVVPEGDAPTRAPAPDRHEDADAAAARAARQSARAARRATRRDSGRSVGLVLGALLILIGVAFLVREMVPAFDFDLVWPLALVALGVVVLVVGLGRDAGKGGTSA